MNRLRCPRSAWLLAAAILGCEPGPPSTNVSGPMAPHQGSMIKLPDDRGFVEVVQKTPTSPKASIDKELSFYFLKDATTPFAPMPTAGTLVIGKKTVDLKADGDALVTPSGPSLFPKGDLEGVLNVDLGGASQSIPLRVR